MVQYELTFWMSVPGHVAGKLLYIQTIGGTAFNYAKGEGSSFDNIHFLIWE